ncbi:MAG: intradiol ring-cleavage dioxygenase, partial [Nitrososphaera sp.]
MGTHYKEGAEYKIDIGTDLIIKGRVLAMPNCTPIAHARIEHWQADVQGHYVDKLRAYLLSDKDGGFSFKTEWPG